MEITKNILQILNMEISNEPPETGGILGSHNGILIDEVVMDVPIKSDRPCSYSPSVDFFNRIIEEWQEQEVCFMGIFHTHFFGVKTLSDGDKKYINLIMNSMPQNIVWLYFPIFVLPERELICYRAEKINGTIEIYREDCIVNDKSNNL